MFKPSDCVTILPLSFPVSVALRPKTGKLVSVDMTRIREHPHELLKVKLRCPQSNLCCARTVMDAESPPRKTKEFHRSNFEESLQFFHQNSLSSSMEPATLITSPRVTVGGGPLCNVRY